MDDPSTEALIWMAALRAALERANNALTQHERLTALEALDETRTRLDEALARVREDVALGVEPKSSPLLS